MSTFILKFKINAREFKERNTAEAIASTLRHEAERIIVREMDDSREATIFDQDGNAIGEWEWEQP
jgi:hypothetical protein